MKRYIRSSSDRKKYGIHCEQGSSQYTDYPEVAIKAWFQMEEKYPMDCAIYAYYKDDAIELVNFALSHETWLKGLYEKYNCPYTWEWLYDRLVDHSEDRCRYFLGNGEFGDQISPFSYG